MNISGVIVHARREKLADVEAQLRQIAGVEVHAATEDGRLIVTVEDDDDRVLADNVMNLQNVPGVLSAAMVYHQFEENI